MLATSLGRSTPAAPASPSTASLGSSSPPMSVELAPSTSDNRSSSNEQADACSTSSHIVELSEIIVGEIDSNTWVSGSSGTKTTIFQVPRGKLQGAGKSTYEPSFLSIGPYYSGDNATEEMRRNEQGKLWNLGSMVRGGGPPVLEHTKAVASMEATARSCYEGDVRMDQDAFCKMLLLDACQLIPLLELLAGEAEAEAEAAADAGCGGGSSHRSHGSTTAYSTASRAECSIRTRDFCMTVHDIMMLENQIPFFVVEKMYELRYGDAAPIRSLAWEAMEAIMGGIPPASGHDCYSYLDDDRQLQHLVHLCHLYLKPTCLLLNNDELARRSPPHKGGSNSNKYGRFRRATEYYEAGVKFRRWCAPAASAGSQRRPMLDVTFTGGVVSMALQSIDENTGYILANVLAYEQKYYRAVTSGDGSYVTAYVVFMSQLLSCPEDVALLSSRGVMEHHLGNDGEVCDFFRGLADGLFFDPDSNHYLDPVGAALQGHCRHRRHRWRAWVVRHRFGNPWLVAAWLFGASAVACTIIQTVFTVLSYVKAG